jgi:exonuclease III
MKIATWNIERLKHLRKLDEIVACCNAVDADILMFASIRSQGGLLRFARNEVCFASLAMTFF